MPRLGGRTRDLILDQQWACSVTLDKTLPLSGLPAPSTTRTWVLSCPLSRPALNFLPGWGTEQRERRKAPADDEGAEKGHWGGPMTALCLPTPASRGEVLIPNVTVSGDRAFRT